MLIGILLVVSFALFCIHAGRKELHTGDEARTLLIARDMVREGHWFVPRVQGKVILTKPPLLFWAIALLSRLYRGEVTEFTGILPVALSASAGVIALFFLGEQLFHRRLAFLAALILATTPQYFWVATQFRVDMPLTLCIMLSFWAFYRGYRFPETHKNAFLLFFLFLALGTSVKGPLGVIVPLLPIICYLWWTKELYILQTMRPLRGLLLYALLLLPWLLPALLQHEIDYRTLVFQQTVVRYVDSWDTEAPFYFYVPSLLVNLLPWTPFLFVGILLGFHARTAEQKKPFMLLLLWFVTNFLFFSLSSGKRDRYILPLYPATALLIAFFWERALTEGKAFLTSKGWRIPVYGVLLLSVLGGFLLIGGEVVRQLALFPKMTFFFPQAPFFMLLLTGIIWGGGVMIYLGYQQQKPAWVFGAIWGMMFLLLTLGPVIFFPQYNRSQDLKGFAQELLPMLHPAGKLCGYDFEKLPLNFYLDRRMQLIQQKDRLWEFLRTQSPAYCLMEREQYDEIQNELPAGIRALKERQVGRESFVLIGTE
jgi:4-amino-4-deoxy-L-arabinose transferase-like glycosyltransferase